MSGLSGRKSYDARLLSRGAAPIRPPLPGIDLPGVFVLRTIPDNRRIREWIDAKQAKRAVVVGGGFIGLEIAENLAGAEMERRAVYSNRKISETFLDSPRTAKVPVH